VWADSARICDEVLEILKQLRTDYILLGIAQLHTKRSCKFKLLNTNEKIDYSIKFNAIKILKFSTMSLLKRILKCRYFWYVVINQIGYQY